MYFWQISFKLSLFVISFNLVSKYCFLLSIHCLRISYIFFPISSWYFSLLIFIILLFNLLRLSYSTLKIRKHSLLNLMLSSSSDCFVLSKVLEIPSIAVFSLSSTTPIAIYCITLLSRNIE